MTAIDPPQVEFLKKAGMPLTQEARITFTEVEPLRRLAYIHLADFIPGVDPTTWPRSWNCNQRLTASA